MQVGAISDGGKGKESKSKSTGDKGKSKGKSKGKGKGKGKDKHKGNDGDKNKERDDWNNGQRQAKFEGYCSNCSKWGHKLADRRTRLVQQKMVQWLAPESEAEDVKAAQWSDVDSEDVDMDSSSWCFAALNNPRGPCRQWCRRLHLSSRFAK